jgi:hypothetical protein
VVGVVEATLVNKESKGFIKFFLKEPWLKISYPATFPMGFVALRYENISELDCAEIFVKDDNDVRYHSDRIFCSI